MLQLQILRNNLKRNGGNCDANCCVFDCGNHDISIYIQLDCKTKTKELAKGESCLFAILSGLCWYGVRNYLRLPERPPMMLDK